LFVAAAVVLGISVWRRQPAPVLLQVSGGSMAPLIYGDHFAVSCASCSAHYTCGVEHAPQAGIAVCPNCGYQQQLTATAQPGVQLEVQPVATSWTPRRGDLVVCRHPQQGILMVKRVAALPGERVDIASGDLLINGKTFQKNLKQLQAMAIPVYSDLTRSSVVRWELTPGWQKESNGYAFNPAQIAQPLAPLPQGTKEQTRSARAIEERVEERTWLNYQHQRCYRTAVPRAGSPLTDHYGYNQGLSRTPVDIRDVLVTFQLQGDPVFSVAMKTAADTVLLNVSGNQLQVRYAGRQLHSQQLPVLSSGWRQVAFAICDGRALWAVDAASGAVDIPPGVASTTQPVSIGAAGAGLKIRNLRISRDIYYLPSAGHLSAAAPGRTTSQNGYFLLGDNPPVSIDSRHWRQRIQRTAIIGRVQTSK